MSGEAKKGIIFYFLTLRRAFNMQLTSVRIVLVETSHPGNIGSTARAMKTMGLSDLYLVNPKAFPHEKAVAMSAGADDILNNAVVTDSLADALKGCHCVIGSSARPRMTGLPGLNPQEVAETLQEKSEQTTAALVFGREHAGLTNEELLHCHYHTMIPANPDYSSLNLAQAVQVYAYELRKNILSAKVEVSSKTLEAATSEDIAGFLQHYERVLRRIGFLKTSNEKTVLQKIKRLFNRSMLEDKEVRLLRGILTETEKNLQNQGMNLKE